MTAVVTAAPLVPASQASAMVPNERHPPPALLPSLSVSHCCAVVGDSGHSHMTTGCLVGQRALEPCCKMFPPTRVPNEAMHKRS